MIIYIRSYSIYYIIALLFMSRSAGSTVDFNSIPSLNTGNIQNDDIIKQAESLRDIGKSYLSAKEYSKAALCYTAVLQVIEGIGGTKSGDLRLRCGLKLAECEIKTGNLYSAIARCSEVIEECPDITIKDNEIYNSFEKKSIIQENINNSSETDANIDSDINDEPQNQLNKHKKKMNEELRLTLGYAYYRRSVALSRLDLPELALLDLQDALRNIPNDTKIIQRIETLESIIINNCNINDSNSRDSNNDSSISNNNNVDIDSNKVLLNPELVLVEQLQSIIEDSQSNYDKSYFTKKQICNLLNKRNVNMNNYNDNIVNMNKKNSGMGGMEDLFAGGLGEGLGGSLGGMRGLAGLMGMGSSGSKGVGAGNIIKSLLSNVGTFLQMFTSINKDTIKLIDEIIKAFIDAFEFFRTSYLFFMNKRSYILFAFSLYWIIITFLPYFKPLL